MSAREMTVKVRDHATEARRWGSGPAGPVVVTVTIPAVCPRCGGDRGPVRGHNQYGDGEWYHVNVWTNPCGHIDYYDAVVLEAAEYAAGRVCR